MLLEIITYDTEGEVGEGVGVTHVHEDLVKKKNNLVKFGSCFWGI